MRFEEVSIPGARLIRLEPKVDARGSFARLFDADLFAREDLCASFPQQSMAVNTTLGTVRGLHYQRPPHEEVKVVHCVRGKVYDVLVDLRRSSPTCGAWEAFELSEDDPSLLYVPAGVAHGYQTLTARADLYYLISAPYAADVSTGVRFDDPDLSIAWPLAVALISDRDRALPPLGQAIVEG